MTCDRFREFDVEAFLAASDSAAFDAFRMHLFDCAACSEAVAGWTEFEQALADVMDSGDGPGPHPEPERLELFARAKDQMGDEAMAIENHVTLCRTCQTELSALARFEDGFLAAIGRPALAAPSGPPATAGLLDGWRDAIGEWMGGWRIAVPAFAAAVLIVAGLWMSGALDSRRADSGLPEPAPQVVMEAPVEGPMTVPPAASPEPPSTESPDRLAMGIESPSRPDRDRVPAPIPEPTPESLEPDTLDQNLVQEEPVLIAEAPPSEARPEPDKPATEPPTKRPETPQPREEILLAALTELPLPDYTMPPQAGSVGWMRQFGAVRGETTAAQIETRAPQNHAGLALSSAPRLWWNLSQETDLAVEITVVDDRKLDPVARIELPGPITKGLHSVDLSQHSVSLEAGIEYRWFVSLIVDPDRPSRNPVAAGALRVLSSDDPRRSEALAASPSERGHALARLGVWYDAYDFFASISKSHPDLSALTRHREHLTKTAGAGG